MLRLSVENIVRFSIIKMKREQRNSTKPDKTRNKKKDLATNANVYSDECVDKECPKNKNGHHDFRSGKCVLCGCVIRINGGRRTRNKHHRRRSSTRRR
jgi:hypothetical protein